jgi:disulfide bond formation protein DsbB
MSLASPITQTQTRTALLLFLGTAATVGTALGFEHIGGYIPCMLCLQQRIPYYVAIPVAAAALIAIYMHRPAIVSRFLLLIIAVAMTIGFGLAVYHSGVEYGWWLGPASCGAVPTPAGNGNGILDQLNTVIPPSCDSAAWRDPIIGLSFAGWNVLASALWAIVAYRGALKA